MRNVAIFTKKFKKNDKILQKDASFCRSLKLHDEESINFRGV